MILKLNPFKWGKPKPDVPTMTLPEADAINSTVVAKINAAQPAPLETKPVANKFLSLLEDVGKFFEKGLTFAVKYLPSVDALAAMIFPAAVAPLAAATATADLIQNAVVTVEQKYAAAGLQNGTGTQKAAEVLALVSQAVTALLAEPTVAKELADAKITVDSTYISGLINAIVGILNVKGATATA